MDIVPIHINVIEKTRVMVGIFIMVMGRCGQCFVTVMVVRKEVMRKQQAECKSDENTGQP